MDQITIQIKKVAKDNQVFLQKDMDHNQHSAESHRNQIDAKKKELIKLHVKIKDKSAMIAKMKIKYLDLCSRVTTFNQQGKAAFIKMFHEKEQFRLMVGSLHSIDT